MPSVAREHHLWMISRHVVEDELIVDLVAVLVPVHLFIEHHIACDVDMLGRRIIRAVGH
jgi:hypothetical protein